MKGGIKEMESLMNKKGQLGTLQGIVISLVVIGIVLGAGFMVLEGFEEGMTDGSAAESGVNDTIYALREVPEWLDVIVIVAIVGIILAIVFAVLPRNTSGI